MVIISLQMELLSLFQMLFLMVISLTLLVTPWDKVSKDQQVKDFRVLKVSKVVKVFLVHLLVKVYKVQWVSYPLLLPKQL
ncbi:MAG: hypothetical protein EBS89_01990 [Proteobacteria bacterium]|nr:hypothetical protein [Pseudomonadota bacterium]